MKSIKLFIREFIKNNLLFHSAQNAFYFVLSIFPFLYILTKIFIIIPLPSEQVLKSLELLFPKEALKIIYSNLNSISKVVPSVNSIPYILVALWSSSMLIYSLKSVFAIFYNKKPIKNKLHIRVISIAITSIVLIVIFFTFVVVFFINLGLSILVKHLSIDYSPYVLSLISLALIIFDIVLLYIILPPARIKITHAVPGAVFAISGLTVFSYGFSYYINYIADYSRIYGALGSVITLLLWLYFCSVIILSGGLINAKFFKEKDTP